jgi:hypothetical protein
MLLVVSVVVGALATSKAGAVIKQQGERIVCRIAGDEDCAAKPVTRRLARAASSGPPLGDGRPITVLPFPGSVSVSCTYDERSPNVCEGSGVGVSVTADRKLERTPTTLDANGCPWQTASVSTGLKLTGSIKGGNEHYGGSLSTYLGKSTNYSITTSPGAMDAIAKGKRNAPNPVDPRTIKAGESVELTREWYKGTGQSASYHNLQLELGYDKGKRVSSGVQRVGPTTLRVMVGDEEFVRQALKVGVNVGVASFAIGNNKELADGKLHAVDINVGTQQGWKTYQDFLRSGKLPGDRAPGASSPTNSYTIKYSDTTSLEANLGPFSIGGRGASAEGRWTTQHNANGSTDSSAYSRYNDTAFAITLHRDANGRTTGSTYSLLLHDLDGSYIPSLYQRAGQPVPKGADHTQDVRIDFTPDQLRAMQRIALQNIQNRIKRSGGPVPSLNAIRSSLQRNHGVVKWADHSADFGGLASDIGGARNLQDLLIAIYSHGWRTPNQIIEDLATMSVGVTRDWPITIKNPKCR